MHGSRENVLGKTPGLHPLARKCVRVDMDLGLAQTHLLSFVLSGIAGES